MQIRRAIETSGLGIREYCRDNKIDDETALLIMLIYAKDYYGLNLMKEGDALVDEVRKVSSKSEKLKSALSDVWKNRNFYQNRPRESGYVIIRVVKP